MEAVIALIGLVTIGLNFAYRAYQDKKNKESHATLEQLAQRDRDVLRDGLDRVRKS